MRLRYREDKSFRIVQLTDLHIGSKPYAEDDYKTFELIEKAFTQLDADLIVLTGDLMWSDGVPNAMEVYRELLECFNQYNVPIAITYGNHDSEDEYVRSDMRRMESILHHHVPKQNSQVVNDRESYTVEIFDPSGKSVQSVLYVFDTGSDAPLPVGIYDWIQPEQVQWFNQVSQQYRRDNHRKTDLVMTHIPLPEYWQAAENIVSGECNETNDMISAPYINTGLFASLYMNGQIGGVFCGHDHENNFVGIHHGIPLVYGQVSGYQCYGDMARGARIIEINEEGMTTYTKTLEEF
ncbi:metallophosphoesterase family protein [Aerococcaceae bacterium WGS1372]